MQDEKDWLRKPKPNVDDARTSARSRGSIRTRPGLEYRRYQRLMFDVIALALQTDSTRVISYMARMDGQDGTGAWRDMGNPYNYHEMTHHGEDPDKLKWFTQADIWYMEEWAYFLEQAQVDQGRGRHAARSHAGRVRQQRRRDQRPPQPSPADHARRRRAAGRQAPGPHHQRETCGSATSGAPCSIRMQVPLPKNFQGGEADGIIKELV